MFTGLITGIGVLRDITPIGAANDARLIIDVPVDNPEWANIADTKLGASIACSGCCLTVIGHDSDSFTVEVSGETLSATTIGSWVPGTLINLEASLRLGDALGGHLVSGHVDGMAEVTDAVPEAGSTRWRFCVDDTLAPFIAPKGSIAINGVSLTVNAVQDGQMQPRQTEFGVNIIPHTAAQTNFATLKPGDRVNIEIDMLARYLARMQSFRPG